MNEYAIRFRQSLERYGCALATFAMRRVVICIFALIGAFGCFASINQDKIATEFKIRLEKGRRYAAQELPDSAEASFRQIVEFRDVRLSKESKAIVMDAHLGLAQLCLSERFNYTEACDHLRQAILLADESGAEKSRIYLMMGLIVHTLVDSHELPDLLPQARQYYRQAVDEATRHSNVPTAVVGLLNLVEISRELDCLEDITPQMNAVGKLQKRDDVPEEIRHLFQDTQTRYEVSVDIRQGNYDGAIAKLSRQLDEASLSRLNLPRHQAIITLLRSTVYFRKGELDLALRDIEKALAIADSAGLTDLRLSALHHMAEAKDTLGRHDEAIDIRNHYLQLRDSVLNFRHLTSVNELQVMEKIHGMDMEMEIMRQHNKMATVIIVIVGLVAIAIGTMLYVLHRKNREILFANETLYKKNVELLRIEEERQSAKTTDTTEDRVAETEKYRSSNLDEDKKAELMERILDVMGQEDVVCDTEFSAERLSQLLGVPYKYLSQVINELYGSNFNTFVNEYRIKVACRLMHTPASNELTIEAIANRVGFKSRSAFGRVFKSTTGLSPSEYMKRAKSSDGTVL